MPTNSWSAFSRPFRKAMKRPSGDQYGTTSGGSDSSSGLSAPGRNHPFVLSCSPKTANSSSVLYAILLILSKLPPCSFLRSSIVLTLIDPEPFQGPVYTADCPSGETAIRFQASSHQEAGLSE